MFAYPSGHAHVGHVRNYMIGDIVARLKRMQGFNVLHPFGWDAFGLPAENAAIKNKLHPETWTLANIAHMKGQLQRLGISYAWGREIATCLPDYYRWNQWLFLRMLEKGIAYRRRSSVNWCPTDQTVLANEQVIDGACWRCGTQVTTRDLEQWFLRITQYADELLDATAGLSAWPEKVLTMQQNWIGRSTGVQAVFPLVDPVGETSGLEIFTTRIDTIYGATFVLLAPEHPLVDAYLAGPDQAAKREAVAKLPRPGSPGADVGRSRQGRRRHRTLRDQPVHRRARPDLGGELRARRLRHGRDHGGAVRRPARLRVREEVRPADPRGGGARGGRGDRSRRRRSGDDGRSLGRLRPVDQLGRVLRPAERRGLGEDGRSRRGQGHRPAVDAVPAQGLGHLAAALLGHADPGGPLPGRRHRRGAGRSAAGRAPEGGGVHRARRLAAGADRRVGERVVSKVRRAGAPRDGHDGHLRRFVLVLLPLLRSEEQRAAVRAGDGALLGPGRLLQRRRRARHPPPDLLAVLLPRVPRPRLRRSRRAVRAPADAGHGAEGRQRDVEVEGERGRPRRHDPEVRRRRAAPLRDVRGAAGEGGRVDRLRPRRQLPVPGPRVASRRAAR